MKNWIYEAFLYLLTIFIQDSRQLSEWSKVRQLKSKSGLVCLLGVLL